MLPDRGEQLAVQRPRGTSDAQDQRLADFAQRLVDRVRGNDVDLCEHGLEAALEVDAVIGVADRPIELGQLVGVADDRVGDRLDHVPRRALIEVHRMALMRGRQRAPGRVEIQRLAQRDARAPAGVPLGVG